MYTKIVQYEPLNVIFLVLNKCDNIRSRLITIADEVYLLIFCK